MNPTSTRRHLFISHHHADDEEVDKLASLLGRAGYDIRNSSVRLKPLNQRRMERGEVKDETIRRLLRMKISWAQTVVVLIGKETHSRRWVDWEIDEAHRQGKRIIGVYSRGGQESDVPAGLEKYASAIVGWQSTRMMAAIDGEKNPFEQPDGSDRPPTHASTTTDC